MRENWTGEQLAAIKDRDDNLLVSAAAGSGKTAVLIERIIRLITEEGPGQADVDRLLVVTFTKAAAAEMRSRLRERLLELQRGGGENEIIARQLALLPNASISTFDALCQRIVRESFVALDVDPSFKVGDDEELGIIRIQALEEVFELLYENDSFKALVETACEKVDDFELREIVLSVFDFIQSERAPDRWLSEKIEYYNISGEISDTFFGKTAYEYAFDELSSALRLIKKARAAIDLGGPPEYYESLKEEAAILEETLLASDYAGLAEKLRNIQFKSLPAARKPESPELKEMAQKYRDEAKKKISAVRSRYFFKDSDSLAADMRAVYPVLKTLSEAVRLFSERNMELKKEKRILSFADIKLLCYRALVDENGYTQAANSYKKLFKYVMVDEYQDTNDVEEGILDALSGNSLGIHNRFMVGDVKQSIYRFRQSKPALFIEKSDDYSQGSNGRLITLHKNFRSQEAILECVNFIFSQIMSRSASEIDYDSDAALICGTKSENTTAVNITLIETELIGDGGSLSEDEEFINELRTLELEAGFIADEISALLNDGKAELKDIVVLMRSGKRNGALVADVLAAKGIPSFAEGKSGYFELTEISDILSLLNIIDNPLQEIPLLTALTSPIFGFSYDELVEIRAAGKGHLYQAMESFVKEASTVLSDKVKDFLEQLGRYREAAFRLPVGELVPFLYDDTGYYIIVGAMENGGFRQANLRGLAKRAADFEKSAFPGLFHFVRHMERLKERDMLARPDEAAPSGAVRIMTIHKSKGLEFPVVFLAGCGSKFNLMELNERFVLHQELGYGAVYVDYENRIKSDTLPRSVVKERLRREALAEEMRLLYVAMTRAKKRLYITGSAGKDASKALAKWAETHTEGAVFSPGVILGAGSYLDWIMPAALRSPYAKKFLEEYGVFASCLESPYGEKAAFNLRCTKRSEAVIGRAAAEAALTREQFLEKAEEMAKAEGGLSQIDMDKLFNWKYNYETDINLPVKLSVSEIKTSYQKLIAGEMETGLAEAFPSEDELILTMPQFMQEKKGLSPSERGTAVHSVLARLDVKTTHSAEDVVSVMDGLLESKILNNAEYDSIDVSLICGFLKSEIAERMRRADTVRREVPFVIGLSAAEAFQPPSTEEVLVHGIIDCFFEENGKIVVLDYKTDYVHNEDFEEIRRKYKIQLEIYRKAAGKITRKPVSEAYLYMLRYGKSINMFTEN